MAGDAPEKKLRVLLYKFYVMDLVGASLAPILDPPMGSTLTLSSEVVNTGHTKGKYQGTKIFIFASRWKYFSCVYEAAIFGNCLHTRSLIPYSN